MALVAGSATTWAVSNAGNVAGTGKIIVPGTTTAYAIASGATADGRMLVAGAATQYAIE